METNMAIDGNAVPQEDVESVHKAFADMSINPEMASLLDMWSRNRLGRHHKARAARAKARIAKRKSKR